MIYGFTGGDDIVMTTRAAADYLRVIDRRRGNRRPACGVWLVASGTKVSTIYMASVFTTG
jgi:hypothetical protein